LDGEANSQGGAVSSGFSLKSAEDQGNPRGPGAPGWDLLGDLRLAAAARLVLAFSRGRRASPLERIVMAAPPGLLNDSPVLTAIDR
jgi:hypothetical protein